MRKSALQPAAQTSAFAGKLLAWGPSSFCFLTNRVPQNSVGLKPVSTVEINIVTA